MSLGEALGGISGEKFRGEKNDEKKVGKAVHPGLPRRDTRTPVRRDFREESLGMGPARLRSSFGWAGGLIIVAAEPSHRPPILSIEFSLEFGSNSMVSSIDSDRILAFF